MTTPHNTSSLPVMEMFYSVQGEGANTGMPAFFIRLAGCDVGCHWCDVKESWNAAKHPLFTITQILDEVKKEKAQTVVVTGGEPLLYNLVELTDALKKEGIKILLETSGAYPLSGSYDWICVSPKKFKAPLPEVLKHADELKLIVFNASDFEWAQMNQAGVKSECKLYLQPEWEVADKMIPAILTFIKSNPKWNISLQTHKWMEIR